MFRILGPHTDPFAPAIGRFIQQEFPHQLPGNHPDLLELLSTTIMGTKQTRYGPKPAPEGQVLIRDVIRHYIAKDEPIPFMVPWGSQKPTGASVDMAEVGALRTMDALHKRVQAQYAHGLTFNVRIEDASAPFLYKENADEKRAGAQRYVRDMEALRKVFGLQGHIRMMPESSLVTEAKFAEEATLHLATMEKAVHEVLGSGITAETLEDLKYREWKGGIAPETVEFYLARYNHLYPNRGLEYNIRVLARYFASALARKRLGVRGDCPAWEGRFIDLSFAPIVPGTDAQFARRVQYRTFPTEFTKHHMAPWRSKGYVEVNGDGEVTPKLAMFSDDLPYTKNTIVLENDDAVVELNADYVCL